MLQTPISISTNFAGTNTKQQGPKVKGGICKDQKYI